MSRRRQTTSGSAVLRIEELENLPEDALIARVRPILRRTGLLGSTVPQWVKDHHEENVPAAVWTLAHEWKDGALIDGGRVPFHESVAARLPSLLVKIDRQQRPEQYDKSANTYAPVPIPEPIPDHVETPRTVEDEATADRPSFTELLASFQARMNAQGFAVPSQMAALRTLAAVASERAAGVEMSPYRMGVATSAADRVHGLLDTTSEQYQRAYDDAVSKLRPDD